MAKRLGSKKVKAITQEDIEKMLARLRRRADGSLKAPDTRRANVVIVLTLFSFAVTRGYLKRAPFEKLEKPRQRPRERLPTKAEDAAVDQRATPAFRRIFRAMRLCGARPGELASASISDYRADQNLIVLEQHKTCEKTGRVRKIGVGEKLRAILTESIGARTQGPLFLDDRGKPWTAQKLSKRYKRCCRKAGLAEDLCLYLQRHAHATEMCEKAGVYAAAQSLGHADVSTTASRYVKPKDSLLASNQDLID